MTALVGYACTGGIRGGVARCRNMSPCSQHPNGQPPAPRPDVILVKINLGKLSNPWNQEFDRHGVKMFERSQERALQLSEKHGEQAERLGRDPLAIRRRTEGEENLTYPEAKDSGSPVFGVDGLTFVNVAEVISDLQVAGFRLTNAYRLARDWKPPVRLVLEFSNGEKAGVKEFPWDVLKRLTSETYGKVDVWANPRDDRGLVVHTVNCGQREGQARSDYRLVYAGGDWGVS